MFVPKRAFMNTVDLSIVIPAYNESQRIGRLLQDIADFAAEFQGSLEIILSDDGSQDDTAAVARRKAAVLGLAESLKILAAPENRGKGDAVRRGMLHSRGELALFCDADGATPMQEFFALQRQIEAGSDIAIGSRDLPGANLVVPQPWYRRAMGAVMKGLVRRLVIDGFADTQCGFKLFRRAAGQAVFSRQTLDGFSFDVEVLYIARHLGLRVVEVPVEWHDQPDSKVDPVKAPPSMVRDLLLIRWRHQELKRARRRAASEVVQP